MGFWFPLTELLPRPLECFWLHNSRGQYHWCVSEWIWGKWISLLKAIEQYDFLLQLQLYHCYVFMYIYGFWDYYEIIGLELLYLIWFLESDAMENCMYHCYSYKHNEKNIFLKIKMINELISEKLLFLRPFLLTSWFSNKYFSERVHLFLSPVSFGDS